MEEWNKYVLQVLLETYSVVRGLSCNRAAVQSKETGKWGFVDRTGDLIIDCKYDEVEDFLPTD